MTYGPEAYEMLDAARAARLSDEANAEAFAPTLAAVCEGVRRDVEAGTSTTDTTSEVRTQFDRIADTAERVGYTQALVDLLRLLDHDRDGPAVDIVTALARQKGIGT